MTCRAVPIEPTDAMLAAGDAASGICYADTESRAIYRAMVSAAPSCNSVAAPSTENLNRVLHILRNPFPFNPEQQREARLWACDELERHHAEAKELAQHLRWALLAMRARTPYADEGEHFKRALEALGRVQP